MTAVIKKLFSVMERSNKQMQIQSSGSVSGNTNEKIRSGQSYLYRKYGIESEVFEIRFKDKLIGSFLQQALIKTM